MNESVDISGYELSRKWFDFTFENTSIISPAHTALYFFIIEHNNRLGWKKEFGLPRQMAMDALGIKNHRTYSKIFENLIEWGFVKVIERAKNQYSSNIIAIVKNTKATTKALDRALYKQLQKQSNSTDLGIVCIDKPLTNKPLTNKQERGKRFSPPTLSDVKKQISEKKYLTVNAESFINFYGSKNWMIGKNKMTDWKKALGGWESRNQNESNQKKATSSNFLNVNENKYG